MRRPSIDVFRYLDYRAYLHDYYLAQKRARAGFSYRAFATAAGVRSPNFIKLVIDGKRNLSEDSAARIAHACGLSGKGAAYFLDIVGYGQAKTAAARANYFERLVRFRRYRETHRLEAEIGRYYSQWYIPAVRELVEHTAFDEAPEWIAQHLLPPITVTEAEVALATLLELGLIARDERGRLRQTQATLATSKETRSFHVANFHRAMMERASSAIDLVPASERDISSLTLGVRAGALHTIKERIQRFREELLDIALRESVLEGGALGESTSGRGSVEQIIQINLQLFPLSQSRGK